jgi:hypothetical protein
MAEELSDDAIALNKADAGEVVIAKNDPYAALYKELMTLAGGDVIVARIQFLLQKKQ